MKNKNSKIIAFVMVFALLIAMVLVTSVANAKTTDIVITSDKETISAGETAIISVKVTTNYPVATMSIPVFYDKTLVDVSDAATTLTEYAVANTTTESQSVDAEKIYANTDIDSSKFGFVLATYIGGANTDVAESIDETVFTFKITAKADVAGNAVVKVVEESAKTSENVSGMLYFGAVSKGTTITDIPENVESKDLETATANVKIGSDKNTLVLNENAPFEAIIDLNNTIGGEYTGTVYGFDTLGWSDTWEVDGTIADFLSTAYGDDYLEVVLPDAGVETTGTVINVLDDNGDVVESYVFIYFGDLDMDGNVGASDSAIAIEYEMYYAGIETLDAFMAGDLDSDSMPGSSDGAVMVEWEMYYEYLPYQSEVGANTYGNIVYEIF